VRVTQKKLLKIVKNNYNGIAKNFNQTRNKKLWPVLLSLTEQVNNNDNILDAGCGNGRLIKAFENKSINYIGFDNSEELIKLAKINFPEQKFIINNIIKMPNIDDNSFDWIFSIAVLHHIPGQKLRIKTLQNLKEKLKNNGKLIITVWNLWDYKDYKLKIIKFYLTNLFTKNRVEFGDFIFDWKSGVANKHKERYYHAFRIKSLKKLIEKSG
jgi:SAM-dependent methyltransferase